MTIQKNPTMKFCLLLSILYIIALVVALGDKAQTGTSIIYTTLD
jgi:hypothetical protein